MSEPARDALPPKIRAALTCGCPGPHPECALCESNRFVRAYIHYISVKARAAERRGMERAARLVCVHCANGEPLEPASPGVDTLYQHPCDAEDCDLGGGPHPCDADLILDALAAEEDDA